MSHERRGCPSCGTWFDTIPRLTQALAEAEAALEKIADGTVVLDKAGRHLAHRKAVNIARQALSTIRAAGGGRGHE